MSSVVQQPSQDSVSSALQPLPAKKPRRSNKAPAVKAAVLISRANGTDKRKIARELGIARQTVEAIIEEANLDQSLESGRIQSATLIPEALRVARFKLSQNSENMAIKVLENTIWPLDSKVSSRAMNADSVLNLAINNLIQVPGTTQLSPLVSYSNCLPCDTVKIEPST